jgi:hypothetical protein
MTAGGVDRPAELFELDWATCASLLRTQCVGPLVTAGETPRIVPVNYVAVDGASCSRSRPARAPSASWG